MEPLAPFDLSGAPGLRLVEPSQGNDAARSTHLEIIVPALNEEMRLGPSLAEIGAYLSRQSYTGAITVVDNGSVDRTADLIVPGGQPVPVRVMGCRKPGKGAAVRRGILTSKARFVGFSDADLSTPIETLDTMLPELERGNPVVIASRKCPGAEYAVSQPLVRRLASRAFHKATRLCTADLDQVYDTQCGFKFFETGVARRLFEQSTAVGFAFDVEILSLALMAGYDITEMPARWEHVEGSQVSVSKQATKVLKELLVMRRNLQDVARNGFAPESEINWTPSAPPAATAPAPATTAAVEPAPASDSVHSGVRGANSYSAASISAAA